MTCDAKIRPWRVCFVMRRDCLTPPPDGTPEREAVDRFSAFLN